MLGINLRLPSTFVPSGVSTISRGPRSATTRQLNAISEAVRRQRANPAPISVTPNRPAPSSYRPISPVTGRSVGYNAASSTPAVVRSPAEARALQGSFYREPPRGYPNSPSAASRPAPLPSAPRPAPKGVAGRTISGGAGVGVTSGLISAGVTLASGGSVTDAIATGIGSGVGSATGYVGGAALGTAICGPACGVIGAQVGAAVGGLVGSSVGNAIAGIIPGNNQIPEGAAAQGLDGQTVDNPEPAPFTSGQGFGVPYRVCAAGTRIDGSPTGEFCQSLGSTLGPVTGIRNEEGTQEQWRPLSSHPSYADNGGEVPSNFRISGRTAQLGSVYITRLIRIDGTSEEDDIAEHGNPPPVITQAPVQGGRGPGVLPALPPLATPADIPNGTVPSSIPRGRSLPDISPAVAPLPQGESIPQTSPVVGPAPAGLPRPSTAPNAVIGSGATATEVRGGTAVGITASGEVVPPEPSIRESATPETIAPATVEPVPGGGFRVPNILPDATSPIPAIMPAAALAPGLQPLPRTPSGTVQTATTPQGQITNPITSQVQPPATAPRPASNRPPASGCGCGPQITAAQNAIISTIQTGTPSPQPNNNQNNAGFAAILAKLQTMQQFAEKAWETTRIQKMLDVLTFVGVMHNAAFLSREVGETFGYALGNILAVIGIRDENGSPLDIQGIVGTWTNNFFVAILGQETVNGITQFWNKASAILRSASMIIWTIRGIFDASQDLMEWIGENVSAIGNALRKYNVVGRNAYRKMSPIARSRNRWRQRLDKYFNTLENAEDVGSSFAAATGNVLEIQQEIGELNEQRQQFTDSFRDFVAGAEPDNSQIPIQDAQVGPDSQSQDITPNDFGQGEAP